MDNYGLIIQHLRHLSQLSVRQTAQKIERSIGWLSEVESGKGRSRLTEAEFNRIVVLLGGAQHRPMFRTWVAGFKNRERVEKTFDGAVLRFIRLTRGMTLKHASQSTGLSQGQLSKIETGLKPVSFRLRNQIMTAYGYSPGSFKNLSTDPVRSKAVPLSFKLQIILNHLQEEQIEKVFQYAKEILG